MSKFLLIFLFLMPSITMASGSFSVEPRYNEKLGNYYFVSGLSIYEKLMRNVAYNSWTGFGDGMNEGAQRNLSDYDYKSWYVTTHRLDFQVARLTLSPGFRFVYNPGWEGKEFQTEVYGRIALKIW